ncbi:MAG: phosphofructokinase-like protein [Myxococcota bacterium]
MAIKRIGVLTGGGDCPGLNAVIRAVVKDAIFHDIEPIGIEDGFLGLIENRMRSLTVADASNILTTGGTILGSSNRADPRRYATSKRPDGTPVIEDVSDICMAHIEAAGLDALVVIGGDGTMECADTFVQRGLNCIGIPKTIDNDVVGTDLTFGFTTAVATATEALDRVHSTAASHHRAIVVEVMGRNAGWLALHAGIASGSDVILLPELPFAFEKVAAECERRNRSGRRYTIICCAEGALPAGGEQVVRLIDKTSPDPIRLGGIARLVSEYIAQNTEIESRHVVLGHVQRGGSPVPADRVLATRFGHHAMSILRAGARSRMVALQAGKFTDIDLTETVGKQRRIPVDHPLLACARSVYTSFAEA